ncbi:MAG: ABC transporter permease [Bacteroidales bacterium]|nr:ABC transporter permease [Bacteroidales bacterium]
MSRNNTWVILQREYLNRVKKKSFLVMTILMPLLFVALMFAPALLSNVGKQSKTYLVVDETGAYAASFNEATKDRYVFVADTAVAFDSLRAEACNGVIYIAASGLDGNRQRADFFYMTSEPSMEQLSGISSKMTSSLRQKLMQEVGGMSQEVYTLVNEAEVEIGAKNMETGEQTYSEVKTVLGYLFGFLIYLFIFMFGGMIMSGVIEEKTNRIVEVLISSVRPMQLLTGKIVGISLVGLTQLLIWGVLTFLLVFAGGLAFGGGIDAESLASAQQMAAGAPIEMDAMGKVMDMIHSVNLSRLFVIFIAYFIGGYLLYAAMFAAVGAAVENENDTNQFMLPITVPLILSIIVSVNILNDPNGPVAFWFSIIPFTSPIAMMIRVPFGVPGWELALSLGLLVLGCVGTTYMAAKIYRVGILMYGKKTSYKELWKWLRYKA